MKKTRLFVVLASVLAIFFLLTACYEAELTARTVITSAEGAGTKTVVCEIYKDGAVNRKGDVVSTPADKPHENNWLMINNNPEGIYDWLVANAPEGIDVSWEEKEDRAVYYLTWTFDNFDDYNQKQKQYIDVVGEGTYNPLLHETQFTVTDEGDTILVEMKEEIEATHAAVWWAIEGLYNSGVINPGSFSVHDISEPWSWTVQIGDGDEVETMWVFGVLGVDRSETYVEASGRFAKEGATVPVENPQTSANSEFPYIAGAVALIVLGALFLILRKRLVENH